MFTELIDLLRCPNAHEDSWLVATSSRTGSRHILDGKLGCPVCKATFDIIDGEAMFSSAPVLRSAITLDDDAAFRLAAQLHLVDAPQPIMLTGLWSRAVAPLRRIVPLVTMFVGDATSAITLDEKVSTLRLPPSGIPLAAGSLRALALDRAHSGEMHLSEASRVIGTRGRLVVPAATALAPPLWRIIATDTEVTVAERLPVPSTPIQLRRAPRSPLFTP
ncbi:MAG TPA: hypothetical protein VE861_00020 [Gemmatimonadaceae bacterium]|nr:hypothetical protein [Gemmatimonadaceae bacterium]